MESIINEIKEKLNIYQFDFKIKSFVLEIGDIQKHPLVFNDLQLIINTLKSNSISYILDKNSLSICIDFKDI